MTMELDLASLIRNVPDFPKPGIQFKDVTTLLKNGAAFHQVIDHWKTRFETLQLNAIVGAEARGFIFGAALAYALQLPFVPARKPGKLPSEFISEEYELEYGVERLEMHVDALKPADRVVIVDDLLATGGTVCAIAKMVERLGAEIVEVACVVELPPLKGREKLKNYEVTSLVEFMVD